MKPPKRYINAKYIKSGINPKKSWFLSGNAGTGKTYYCWSLFNQRTEKPEIKIYNYALLVGELRSYEFIERKELERKVINSIYLILDDIGAELRTDYSDDLLFRILNYRYEEMLWTGLTSNLKINQLPYESRIISRIAGIVQGNKHHLESKDRRIAGR